MHRRKVIQTIGSIAGLGTIGVSTVSGQPDNGNGDNGNGNNGNGNNGNGNNENSPFRNYGQAKSQATQAPITGWRGADESQGYVHPVPEHEPMYYNGDAWIWHEPSAGYNMEEFHYSAITDLYHQEHAPGLITLFYRADEEWYYLDVRFNGNGELVNANGVEPPEE